MNELELGGTVSVTLNDFENDLQIRQVADTPGCYCISSRDRTLYVGCSKVSITRRLQSHIHSRRSPYLYDRLERGRRCQEQITITLIATEPDRARLKEVEVIGERSPIYNLWH